MKIYQTDQVFFPVYVLEKKEYRLASTSKYANKSKTGTSRFNNAKDCQDYVDRLNKERKQ